MCPPRIIRVARPCCAISSGSSISISAMIASQSTTKPSCIADNSGDDADKQRRLRMRALTLQGPGKHEKSLAALRAAGLALESWDETDAGCADLIVVLGGDGTIHR